LKSGTILVVNFFCAEITAIKTFFSSF